DQVIAACNAGENDFVNVVLAAKRSDATKFTPYMYESSVPAQDRSSQASSKSQTIAEQVTALADEANRSGGGHHVLRPSPGVEVKGEYDMTPLLPAFHIPTDLEGKTVLDVATASGFFAMECARRGADVTAVDNVAWDTH